MVKAFIEKALVFIFVIGFIELTSLSILSINDYLNGDSVKAIGNNRYAELSPSVITYGVFEPVGGYWSVKGNRFGKEFFVNNYGVAQNRYESHIDPLSISSSSRKILLLGGSSALGFGVDRASETIAAKVEMMLNETHPPEETYVLNFGQIGGYSGDTIRKLVSYLVHFEPDVILWYAGYNDAVLSSEQRHVNWGWASSSALASLAKDSVRLPRIGFMPFTSALVGRVYRGRVSEDLLTEMDERTPVPKLASLASMNSVPSGLGMNLKLFAGICAELQIACIFGLQPASVWPSGKGYSFNKQRKEAVMSWYPKFKKIVRDLEEVHAGDPLFRSVDMTMLFNETEDSDVFLEDGFHLTALGNAEVARLFVKVFESMEEKD